MGSFYFFIKVKNETFPWFSNTLKKVNYSLFNRAQSVFVFPCNLKCETAEVFFHINWKPFVIISIFCTKLTSQAKFWEIDSIYFVQKMEKHAQSTINDLSVL